MKPNLMKVMIATLITISLHIQSLQAQQFQNLLSVSPFADGKWWFLTDRLVYELKDTGIYVNVPAGFVTDFTSIPRIAWSVFPTWADYGPAAIVHDYLYWDQGCTREEADYVMEVAMTELKVSKIRALLIHLALRTFGKFSWNNNRRQGENGWVKEIDLNYLPTPGQSWNEIREKLHSVDPLPKQYQRRSFCDEINQHMTERRE